MKVANMTTEVMKSDETSIYDSTKLKDDSLHYYIHNYNQNNIFNVRYIFFGFMNHSNRFVFI